MSNHSYARLKYMGQGAVKTMSFFLLKTVFLTDSPCVRLPDPWRRAASLKKGALSSNSRSIDNVQAI